MIRFLVRQTSRVYLLLLRFRRIAPRARPVEAFESFDTNYPFY
jgi:hypothetical protein